MSSAPAIWRQNKKRKQILEKEGKVVTFSVVRTAPLGFENSVPYVVAIVELPGRERVTAQVVDWEGREVKIGSKVRAVFRKLYEPEPEGVIPYGIKFKLK